MPDRREWWRSAVLYQIYVRSFCDSNGDGVGDLPGIRSKLPYLRELGVEGVWLTPFYRSPGADHGYDVSDYCDVDPQFGTLDDFDALTADARELGLRVIVDIVPNHCSDRHVWFRNAIGDPSHPDRERFVWASGRDGGPPNNWRSAFGGSAWSPDPAGTGDWYLHLFAPQQPDLDWHNPQVQADFEQILRFWLDRGVDGFRVDVAHALFKDPTLADEPGWEGELQFADQRTCIGRPEVHPLYRRWRQILDEYPGDRTLVGEIVLYDQARVARFLTPDQMHLAFNFTLLKEEWDAERMRATIDRTLDGLAAVGATATWVLENHDVTRAPTRYGGGENGRRRARAGLLLLLALPGTAFLYGGQELGLEEVDLPAERRQDPVFFRTNGGRKGRDGCRVPLPWTPEPPGFGFTSGTPWLPIPAGWRETAVSAQQGDPASPLELVRGALAARHESDALTWGTFRWRDSAPGTLAFERERGGERVVCVVNASGAPAALPDGELLLASEPGIDGRLPAGAAAWVLA